MASNYIAKSPHLSVTLEQWVEALRSGDYPQGQDQLRDLDGSFCCLGLICELDDTFERFDRGIGSYYANGVYEMLYDIEMALPHWMDEGQMRAAIYANDHLMWTFDEIADWVESGMKIVKGDNNYIRDSRPLL